MDNQINVSCSLLEHYLFLFSHTVTLIASVIVPCTYEVDIQQMFINFIKQAKYLKLAWNSKHVKFLIKVSRLKLYSAFKKKNTVWLMIIGVFSALVH